MSSTLNSYTPRGLERCSPKFRAMLPNAKSYAFGHQKLYFQTSKAMLSDAKSYAHGLQKLCFGLSRAMLCTFKSYVPQHSEICFSWFPHGVAILQWSFLVQDKPAPLALPGNFVQGFRLNCCIWTGLSDAQICLRHCPHLQLQSYI